MAQNRAESLIVVMKGGASAADIAHVVSRLEEIGAEAHVSTGPTRTVIGAMGARESVQQLPWSAFKGVDRAVPVLTPFKFVSRDFQPHDSIIDVGGVHVGGAGFTVIAGPCAVESREQLFATAAAVKSSGAAILRGDAFKPRTSPYSFQGIGEKALDLLAEARQEFNMPFIAEAVDPRDVELVASYADLIRVGARNMDNFTLLAELGRQPKPVMLKRGFTAKVDEWLNAAEYVYKEGNHQVILCERGIRTFETATRNTLDISAVPVLRELTHLPVIVDPSHASGRRSLVPALSRAAVAVGAHGVMVDVHPVPEAALVDGDQAIVPTEFAELMEDVVRLAEAMGVKLSQPS